MSAHFLWLIPLLPLIAAGVLALFSSRTLASVLAIGSMAVSLLLSLAAFGKVLANPARQYWNFNWLHFGDSTLRLGFVLDPLTVSMLVMVTLVGLLIFIYSTGYMAEDPGYPKFFCFLSLFAGGMLGVIIANSLLLLFFCWEIVGLASYLLIGFWFFKASAAHAAQKAFITTRIGDLGFFLGMIWLYSRSGTLLFYDGGRGCLEAGPLSMLVATPAVLGISAATVIAALLFCGAAGKSGQFPLHVWLPDAMEGPTPVSALIHAATMVAAGVFLVARVYPLMDADIRNIPNASHALTLVAWIGAITAVFAALIAVAQNDIKRILAYSTVSQLGYMMLGLGTGGVAVGIFHLLTHAFFKALLFLGAGSVIHGCHGEQDIRRMGGLRGAMPVTFATYAVGMMALAGIPVFFSGFWSKDAILHSALHWHMSRGPFFLGLFGAFLTAFYMTRQMIYVFLSKPRLHEPAHESPRVMTTPLVILAAFAIVLGFFGTPVWPWMQEFLTGRSVRFGFSEIASGAFLSLFVMSVLVVGCGLAAGWYLYARRDLSAEDVLELRAPGLFHALRDRLYIDEAYEGSVLKWNRGLAWTCARLETVFFGSAAWVTGLLATGFGWISRVFDNFVIDFGFDRVCGGLRKSAAALRQSQDGKVQNYLRSIAITLTVLVLLLVWGCRGQ